MRIGNIEVKRRVWVGLASGLGAVVAWWAWAQRGPAIQALTPQAKPPFVRLTGVGLGLGDQVLRERADLFDPTPLFFPTEWNFGQRPLRESLRRQPGQVFGSFEPIYNFAEQNMKPYGIEATMPPEKLSDALAQGNEAPFAGFGQIDPSHPVFADRLGFVEVTGFFSPEPIISQALVGIAIPRSDYAPLQFLLVVSSAGIVGDPVLTSGSGWEDVDAFFRAYLVRALRLGERLSPGRYRVLVGP